MRTPYLLLLSGIALSGSALAAESKATANANGKPGLEANSKAAESGRTASGNEPTPNRPTQKNRIRYTFPPSAKRM